MNKIIEGFLNQKGNVSKYSMTSDKVNINNLLTNHNTDVNSVSDQELIKILLSPSIRNFKKWHLSTIKQLQKYTAMQM